MPPHGRPELGAREHRRRGVGGAHPIAEVGLEGDYMGAQRVKITKIEDKMVTVALKTKNTHSLANKTLVFELTLKEIK